VDRGRRRRCEAVVAGHDDEVRGAERRVLGLELELLVIALALAVALDGRHPTRDEAVVSEGRVVVACFGGEAEVRTAGGSEAARSAARWLRRIHAALTRFEVDSELSRLNADPRPAVPASALVRALAQAVRFAGELSGGLVDATRLPALEAAGYVRSRDPAPPAALPTALAGAPEPAPARPAPAAGWRLVGVDAAGRVHRPPGLRMDGGGLVKGLAADLVGAALARHGAYAVDCGGDLRVGGTSRRLLVADPFGGAPVHELALTNAAAATSGIGRRAWRDDRGRPVHHLLDPATGRPAWTGVVQATAIAPTALEAEVRAKAALLAGPAGAATHLVHGGVLVLPDRSVRVVAASAVTASAA
jgi:FAD:protein FMN transferase